MSRSGRYPGSWTVAAGHTPPAAHRAHRLPRPSSSGGWMRP